MSTVLTNGIIIPENGSRNWGGDLANNWNILDVNVGYMTDVKNSVTTLENSVAENTANIQINASNISALQTSKQDALSDQQIANIADVTNKANDSDVVHKSGNETVGGVKDFNSVFLGEQRGVIRIGDNVEGTRFCTLNYDGQIYNTLKQLVPKTNNEYILGTSTNKWKTLNGINPGALSLPNTTDLINITSSITALDGDTTNKFTPQVTGWLLINGTGPVNSAFIYAIQGRIGVSSVTNSTYYRCAILMPIVAGVEVSVTCKLETLTWANIVPCQGNV